MVTRGSSLPIPDNSKPTKWQQRFIDLAIFWSKYYTCDRGAMGAVIVRDKRVIASGYNGAPSGSENCDDIGHAMLGDHCKRTVHAEVSAVAQAAQYRVSIKGCDIYITAFPCWDCTKLWAACRIKTVYYIRPYHPEEWDFYKPLYDQLSIRFVKLEID